MKPNNQKQKSWEEKCVICGTSMLEGSTMVFSKNRATTCHMHQNYGKDAISPKVRLNLQTVPQSWEEKLKPKVTMFPKFQSDRKVQEFALDILNQYWRDLKPEISLLLIKEREAVLKDLIENYMGNKTVSYDCIYIDELEKYLLDSIKSDE